MNEHGYCPLCGADLDGGDIPAEIAHHYSGKKWGRALGKEVRGVYDGVLIWQCPDCDGHWPRFPDEKYYGNLHQKALRTIADWEAKSG